MPMPFNYSDEVEARIEASAELVAQQHNTHPRRGMQPVAKPDAEPSSVAAEIGELTLKQFHGLT